MAYRNPRFYFHHALRSAGVAAIGGSTFATLNPRAYVYDSGLGRLGTFNAAEANQFVKADRGASFAALPQPDRLIIPSGHTISTNTLEVRHHTSDPPDGVTGTLIYGPTAQAAGLRVLTLTALTARYLSVTVPASGAWSFPELWLSVLRTTTRGPDPSWKDARVANQFEAQMRSGETYRLELGSERRYFEFTYRALSGADLLVFTDLRTETRNGLYPVYIDPPDDSESAMLMQLLGGLEFEQDYGAPASPTGMNFKVTLRLLEVLA
jgi:hypothetical protein